MKNTELIVLGLAGLAVWMITKKAGAGTSQSNGALGTVAAFTNEIFDSAGKAFSNGWRYFSDGTSIDPQGNYYSGGQLVYTPYGSGTTGSW